MFEEGNIRRIQVHGRVPVTVLSPQMFAGHNHQGAPDLCVQVRKRAALPTGRILTQVKAQASARRLSGSTLPRVPRVCCTQYTVSQPFFTISCSHLNRPTACWLRVVSGTFKQSFCMESCPSTRTYRPGNPPGDQSHLPFAPGGRHILRPGGTPRHTALHATLRCSSGCPLQYIVRSAAMHGHQEPIRAHNPPWGAKYQNSSHPAEADSLHLLSTVACPGHFLRMYPFVRTFVISVAIYSNKPLDITAMSIGQGEAGRGPHCSSLSMDQRFPARPFCMKRVVRGCRVCLWYSETACAMGADGGVLTVLDFRGATAQIHPSNHHRTTSRTA